MECVLFTSSNPSCGRRALCHMPRCLVWCRHQDTGCALQCDVGGARVSVEAVWTRTLWPAKRYARSCGLKFQTMTQLSREPVISCFMFELKQTEVTASLCPRKERSRVGSSGWGGRVHDFLQVGQWAGKQ